MTMRLWDAPGRSAGREWALISEGPEEEGPGNSREPGLNRGGRSQCYKLGGVQKGKEKQAIPGPP